MNTVNWKTGLQRLYFVALVCWYCFITVVFIVEDAVSNLVALTPDTIILTLAFFGGPVLIHFTAKWIFQGFFSTEQR